LTARASFEYSGLGVKIAFGGAIPSPTWNTSENCSSLGAGNERVVDAKYLDEIRPQAKEFSTKRLSRKAALAECAIRNFKKGKNTIRPRSLRKLVRAIHDLQNKGMKK